LVDCGSKRIGQHIYTKRVENGIAYLIKGCDGRTDKMSHQCGQWTVEEFLAHIQIFDENTELNYERIKNEVINKRCYCGKSKTMPICDGLHNE
jgi:hypothetical protein